RSSCCRAIAIAFRQTISRNLASAPSSRNRSTAGRCWRHCSNSSPGKSPCLQVGNGREKASAVRRGDKAGKVSAHLTPPLLDDTILGAFVTRCGSLAVGALAAGQQLFADSGIVEIAEIILQVAQRFDDLSSLRAEQVRHELQVIAQVLAG